MKLVHCSRLSNTQQGNTCSLRRNLLSLLLYALCHSPSPSLHPTEYFKSSINLSLCPSCRVQTPQGEGGATRLCWPSSCRFLCPFPSYSTTFLVLMLRAEVWDVHLNQCLVSLCYIFDQRDIYRCGQQVLGVSVEKMQWLSGYLYLVYLYWSDFSGFIWEVF